VERARSRVLVDDLVAGMSAPSRRKLALFLFAIDVTSLFVGLRPFRRLSGARQRRILAWLFDSPVGLLRRGLWGVNTLAKLGVYGQTELYDEIGYRVRGHQDG
jgi:hypothetical protein